MKDNKVNVINLEDISEYMYKLIEGLDEQPNEKDWDSISSSDKEAIAKELQLNLNSFVDLMNHFGLNVVDKCSDETIETVCDIINNKLKELETKKEKEQQDNKRISKKANKRPLEKPNRLNGLNGLKLKLNALKVSYKMYDTYIEFSPQEHKHEKREIISILDRNNKECMWVMNHNTGYIVFDKLKTIDNVLLIVPEDVNALYLDNTDELVNLISKMFIENKKDSIKKPTENKKEITKLKPVEKKIDTVEPKVTKTKTSKPIAQRKTLENNKCMSKKEFRRKFLLSHLDELSDEDILNELKRRMSSK